MAYEVEEPVEEQCFLKELDPSGGTWVIIREGRGGEDARRDQLWSEFALERNDKGEVIREHYKMPGTRATFVECYLTFGDANIVYKRKKKDASGRPILDGAGDPIYITEPMFKPGMAQSEFEARFAKLPRAVMKEWRDHVWRLNPDWDPTRQKEIEKN